MSIYAQAPPHVESNQRFFGSVLLDPILLIEPVLLTDPTLLAFLFVRRLKSSLVSRVE